MEPATNCSINTEAYRVAELKQGRGRWSHWRHDEPCRCGARIVWFEFVHFIQANSQYRTNEFKAPVRHKPRFKRCYLCTAKLWKAMVRCGHVAQQNRADAQAERLH
jgi:hypothetical protein